MTTRFFLGLFESGMFPGCEFTRGTILGEVFEDARLMEINLQASTFLECGILGPKLKSVSVSSLARQPWQVLSVVCSPTVSLKWMELVDIWAGAGSSLLRV